MCTRYICAVVLVLGGVLLGALPAVLQAQSNTVLCPTPRVDEQVRVQKVHDGDTIRLADGRSVRLIGINTPELARKGRPAEPLGYVAKEFVQRQLFSAANDGYVKLRYGQPRTDHYGRTLAHVFLNNGSSLSALLLQKGLGQAVVIPHNVFNAECYFAAEQTALQQARGVWKERRFLPVPATELSKSNQGFYIVRGKVKRVGRSRKAIWLQIETKGEPRLALRLAYKDLRYFDIDPDKLLNKYVQARGWMRWHQGKKRRELRMNVRHGLMLKRLH